MTGAVEFIVAFETQFCVAGHVSRHIITLS